MFSIATHEVRQSKAVSAGRTLLAFNLISVFLIGYLAGGVLLPIIVQLIVQSIVGP